MLGVLLFLLAAFLSVAVPVLTPLLVFIYSARRLERYRERGVFFVLPIFAGVVTSLILIFIYLHYYDTIFDFTQLALNMYGPIAIPLLVLIYFLIAQKEYKRNGSALISLLVIGITSFALPAVVYYNYISLLAFSKFVPVFILIYLAMILKAYKKEKKVLISLLVVGIASLVIPAFSFSNYGKIEYHSSIVVDVLPLAGLSKEQASRIEDLVEYLYSYDYTSLRDAIDTSDPDYEHNSRSMGFDSYTIPYIQIDDKMQYESDNNSLTKRYRYNWDIEEAFLTATIYIHEDTPPEGVTWLVNYFDYFDDNEDAFIVENDNNTAAVLLRIPNNLHFYRDGVKVQGWFINAGISIGNANIMLTEGHAGEPLEGNLSSEFIALLCSLLQDDDLAREMSEAKAGDLLDGALSDDKLDDGGLDDDLSGAVSY
jgi:hypothetical protein